MRKGSKKLKGKARLEKGGMFKPNEILTQAGNAAGMLGATVDPLFKETNVAGQAGTGVLKGVGVGAAFGPAGMVIGGLVGGVTGLIGAKKAKEAEEQAKLEQKRLTGNANLNQAFDNAGNQFKHGGKLLAKKLNTVQGGTLNPVSDDAVEVKANNPKMDDSVELENAFVDNNEIIDRKNRVYSDSVFLPNGKSVAKEAKKLEKQKAEDYELRFASANKHIDSKLDKLFEYQEASKPQSSTQKLKKGGKIVMERGEFMEKHDRLLNVLEHGSKKQLHTEHERQEKEVKQYKQKGGTLEPPVKSKQAWDRATTAKKLLPTSTANPFTEEKTLYLKGLLNYNGADKIRQQVNDKYPYGDISEVSPEFDKISEQRNQYKTQLQEQFNKRMQGFKKGGKLKPAYADGTDKLFPTMPLATLPAMPKLVDNQGNAVNTRIGTPLRQGFNEQPTNTNIGFGDKLQSASTALATFGPNVATSAFLKRLKGPKTPIIEQGVKLKRLSPDAQLAAASQQTRQAQEIVRRSTAQGSDAVAAQGSLLARRLNANNEIYGNVNNANAQIQAQEAGLNQSVRARNVERVNQFMDNSVDFNNKIQQLKSENVANLSTKILQQGREKNQMKLDKDKFNILTAQFGDSGVLSRLMADHPEIDWSKYSKEKKKLGGKIRHKLNKNK